MAPHMRRLLKTPMVKSDSVFERVARAWKIWRTASVMKIIVCHCGRPWR